MRRVQSPDASKPLRESRRVCFSIPRRSIRGLSFFNRLCDKSKFDRALTGLKKCVDAVTGWSILTGGMPQLPDLDHLSHAETDALYFSRLSRDSVLSLSLQGGPMSPQEVTAFDAIPHSAAAVQLRRFDEQAKVRNLETPSVRHFLPYVARCMLPN